MRVAYLNTDLELESRHALDGLVAWLTDAELMALSLHRRGRRYCATLEFVTGSDADTTINRFCDCLEKLPEALRQTWNQCEQRVFDLGFGPEPGVQPGSFSATLSDTTLARVAALGAEITVTIYPA